jgi:hypothetical protein
VLIELKKFQNQDKGFGHGLEPDIQSRTSSVICTTIALQYLQKINVGKENQLVIHALKYLEDTFDSTYLGWHPIGPDIENAPHAPWWDYKRSLTSYEWGNPSAEIIGNFIRYERSSDIFSINTLLKKILSELYAVAEPEIHAVLSYLRMFRVADNDVRRQMKDVLFSHIKKVVVLDTAQWEQYVPKPLNFLESPDDEVIPLFNSRIIKKNIDYIKQSLIQNHWEPSWDWGDQHPEAWSTAKKDWTGKLTVENLMLLNKFND